MYCCIKNVKEKYFVIGDHMLDGVLDKIKVIIDIKKFGETKILIDTDDKLADEVNLRNVAVLISCIMKNDDKFQPQLILEEALVT